MVISHLSFIQMLCTWKLGLENMPYCLCAHEGTIQPDFKCKHIADKNGSTGFLNLASTQ